MQNNEVVPFKLHDTQKFTLMGSKTLSQELMDASLREKRRQTS